MIVLRGVSVHYGPVRALDDVTLEVAQGETVAILGANGAGKSSTLRAISGLAPVTSGEILLRRRSIRGLRPDQIAGLGVAHIPEGRHVFPGLTVAENLEIGGYRLRSTRGSQSRSLRLVYEMFPQLQERSHQLAKSLSGGEQQMLAVGRALMGAPDILMLDEPSLGLAPTLVEHVFRALKELQERGLTIIVVEQNATVALEVSQRGYVLETGRLVHQGKAAELLADPKVRAAYLGIVEASAVTSDERALGSSYRYSWRPSGFSDMQG